MSTLPLEIRLVPVNSTTPSVGRVEVQFDGKWGHVCHTLWDIRDAHVACRQLGYARANGLEFFDPDGARITWMDKVQCEGDEVRLWDCRFGGWGNVDSDCSSNQAAGVVCESTVENYQVRLADGPNSREGRVEIAFQGHWGTVCDTDWNVLSATVVCRQLGYPRAVAAYHGSRYGRGEGLVLLDNAMCRGSEERVIDCLYHGWARVHASCLDHSRDAGVQCEGEIAIHSESMQSRLRLQLYNSNNCTNNNVSKSDSTAIIMLLGFNNKLPGA